eukprot:447862_1
MGTEHSHCNESNPNDETQSELETITSRAEFTNSCAVNSPLSDSPKTPELTVLTLSNATSNLSKKRRKSSLLIVRNGITGKYLSSRICKIAAKFWKHNINCLHMSQQLEIGCNLFFSMTAVNKDMRNIMKGNMNSKKTIEQTSIQYLDMFGWLIRHLVTDNIDLHALLTKLGAQHQRMGIKITHFTPMLQAMHDTFSYYFETKYTIEVKYAIDEIFSLAAQLMTGESLAHSTHLMDITKQFQGDDIPFLKNLNVCLDSSIGKEYLYRYLAQTWCDEIAVFIKSISRFKKLMTDKERFFVAKEITKTSINATATFCLNLSYENRQNALNRIKDMERKFGLKQDVVVGVDFFH